MNSRTMANTFTLAALLTILASTGAVALDAGNGKLPEGAAATVNGVALSGKVLEAAVRENTAKGLKDTPELRQALKEELIARELFAQEAARQGLDKTPLAIEQLAQIRQAFLVELLLNDYLGKNPVSDTEVRAEYDRQVADIGDLTTVQQYDISHILLAKEADARAVIAALKKGEDFAQLAQDKSLDPSKSEGGHLGWVLPNQIMPTLANVMVNLDKGSVAVAPIQTQLGWHVLKVNDRRSYQVPTFDESKNQIRLGLLQSKRLELLTRLRQAAKVVQ